MTIDPRVVRGVMGKAKLVLSPAQFKYFQKFYEFDWDVPKIAQEFEVHTGTVYKVLKTAKSIMKNEWS